MKSLVTDNLGFAVDVRILKALLEKPEGFGEAKPAGQKAAQK